MFKGEKKNIRNTRVKANDAILSFLFVFSVFFFPRRYFSFLTVAIFVIYENHNARIQAHNNPLGNAFYSGFLSVRFAFAYVQYVNIIIIITMSSPRFARTRGMK